MGLFDKLFGSNKESSSETPKSLEQGLERTRVSILGKLSKAFLGKSKVDDEFLDELEEILVTSDVGVDTTLEIIKRLEARAGKDKYLNEDELKNLLKEEMETLLPAPGNGLSLDFNLQGVAKPYVILVVGVNGVGKTTTIGKLAWHFAQHGKKVVMGAGDTFRAAAVDQLSIWKERTGAEIISHGMQADPASVAFDAVKWGVDHQADVVIIDTAGRLHNKVGLMNELSKIKRVIQKFAADAPHEVLLVLDATTGQNAFEQAKQFTEATQVNALAITKLDGTAKGGVVIGVSHTFNLPVKYIGIGEAAENLRLFDSKAYIKSILSEA